MRRLLVMSLYTWLALAWGSNLLVLLARPTHTFAALAVAAITLYVIARGLARLFPEDAGSDDDDPRGDGDDDPDHDDPDGCAWPDPSAWHDAA